MRNFVIGDIHGGFKALNQVFDRSNFDDNDRAIFLGDLTDGWSQSFEVIEFVSNIKNSILITGNHDDWAIRFLKHSVIMRTKMNDPQFTTWLVNGGSATLESYIGREEYLDKHINFLKTSIPYYIDNYNRLFVHAGFDINKDINDQKYDTYYWYRKFWKDIYEGKSIEIYNNNKNVNKYKEIYIGHTPSQNSPVNILNIWNIDTGSAFKGKITMMDIDSKKIYQSDKVYTLYEDELGRN